MIARELRWSRRNDDDDIIWTAKTYPNHGYWHHNVDLSFTLESGRRYAITNRNAVLTVRKREEGKKVATKVLLQKEFDNSYVAKNLIDSLLYSARMLYEKLPHMAEQWFLEQLTNMPDADEPEQPDVHTKVHYPRGYPC